MALGVNMLVRELMYFRGRFEKKASQWPSSVKYTIKNPKNVVDNFVKRREGINRMFKMTCVIQHGNEAEKL